MAVWENVRTFAADNIIFVMHERYINPYTNSRLKKSSEQAEIARYTAKERQEHEEGVNDRGCRCTVAHSSDKTHVPHATENRKTSRASRA